MTTMAELELRAQALLERLDPLGKAAEIDRRFIALAGRVVDLVAGRRARRPVERRPAEVARRTDAANRVRELYAREAARRLAAVQWLGRHGRRDELEALKAVLSIEESESVRREILRVVRGLEAKDRKQSGAKRCSSSSAE